jgi:hypothetical protein
MLVQRILLRLYQKLKFWTEGEELESSLGFAAEEFSEDDVRFSRYQECQS